MTQYIKKVNKIEAIKNRGNVLTDVIPFLNERVIPYEYTSSFLRGEKIGIIKDGDSYEKEEYTPFKSGEYLVINKGAISIMSAEDFESKYQEDDGVVRKPIDNQISTNITLDTTKAKQSFDLLAYTVKRIKDGEHKAKQPHVRIEFDDIRDVPKVWVDGELIGGVHDKPLVSLKVDWNTDTAVEGHKEFDINYLDLSDGSLQRKGFHQRTMI
ncbi:MULTISPECIES: hypothetical protein [unclassified Leuconostoc]|uniref:hypothetical protein n=1 Tax=unclassified Leuconostoc TaxID=2685106 RepID=UPI001905160E|nr:MULTISPECIES: hypothetical protein [unclassified Leuconostoc]MBK0041509.1 hypothetical protein [Leuconostoc sp. S51]MBK0052486.1 hypothetical protein [Leuconostoc sp. S50]